MLRCNAFHIAGFVVLVVATAVLALSLATDYWSADCSIGKICTHRGLWKKDCNSWGKKNIEDGLKDIGDDINKDCGRSIIHGLKNDAKGIVDDFKTWELAALVIMCIGVLVAFLSVVLSPCCCNRWGWGLVSDQIFALACVLTTIILYAVFMKKQDSEVDFQWSFWLAVGGAAGLLVSIVLYGVGSSRPQAVYYSRAGTM